MGHYLQTLAPHATYEGAEGPADLGIADHGKKPIDDGVVGHAWLSNPRPNPRFGQSFTSVELSATTIVIAALVKKGLLDSHDRSDRERIAAAIRLCLDLALRPEIAESIKEIRDRQFDLELRNLSPKDLTLVRDDIEAEFTYFLEGYQGV